MASLRYTRARVTRGLHKLNQQRLKRGKELSFWYVLDGKKMFKVRYPKGRGDIHPGTVKNIIDTLRVDRTQFAALAKCPWTGSDYDSHMRQLQKAGQL